MNALPPPEKPRFADICVKCGVDSLLMLQTIADLAGVSSRVADDLFNGRPVSRIDAEKLLHILSQHAGTTLTLDTVDVLVSIPETRGEPQSEVKRLLVEIQQEYESAQQGLTGLAQGTSQHAFITSKMEQIRKLQHELEGIVGDEAITLICEQLADPSDTPDASSP